MSKWSNGCIPKGPREEKIQLSKWIKEVRLEMVRLKKLIEYRRAIWYDDKENPKLKFEYDWAVKEHSFNIDGLSVVHERLVVRREVILCMYIPNYNKFIKL